MTPAEIKEARLSLGLTQAQMAEMLETDATSIKRIEAPPEAATHRSPPPRLVRLLRAYLDGHIPDDWPDTITTRAGPRRRKPAAYHIKETQK